MKHKILVDYRENKTVYSMLEDNDFEVEVITLLSGDYLCHNCLIERKSDNDFINSTRNNLIFQQCQDLLSNPGITPYILITSSIRALEYKGYDRKWIISIITSLNRRGVSTFFVENEDNFISFVKSFFKKYSDDKVRIVNPIRKPVSNEDQILYNYMSIPSVGIQTAKNLKEVFPIPKMLYCASIEQLTEIDGIGKSKAIKIHNFISGENHE